ncbi:MAG: hypothetical protein AAGN46_00240 [Acidobacteriota bacterium]
MNTDDARGLPPPTSDDRPVEAGATVVPGQSPDPPAPTDTGDWKVPVALALAGTLLLLLLFWQVFSRRDAYQSRTPPSSVGSSTGEAPSAAAQTGESAPTRPLVAILASSALSVNEEAAWMLPASVELAAMDAVVPSRRPGAARLGPRRLQETGGLADLALLAGAS